MKNLCAILNICPLYRKALFEAMDKDLGSDFCFGDFSNENIALLNPSNLRGFKPYLGNVYRKGKLVWQKRAVRAAFFGGFYRNYLLTGNPGIKSNWLIAVIARLFGCKVWLWTHGLRGNESKYSKFVNLLYMHLATGMLFYNKRGASLALQEGVSESKIHVIYNSLDYDQQQTCRKNVGDASFLRNYFGNSDQYVIFVGRLTKSKKIDTVIRSLKDVTCNIVIVGDGPERDNIENCISQCGMEDRVWLYGECYDEQMLAQLIYHASLLISPGNVGLSAIHALTYGTIPVTSGNLDTQMPEVEAVIELEQKLNRKFLFDGSDSIAGLVSELLPFIATNRNVIREECYRVVEDHWNVHYQINLMKKVFGI